MFQKKLFFSIFRLAKKLLYKIIEKMIMYDEQLLIVNKEKEKDSTEKDGKRWLKMVAY